MPLSAPVQFPDAVPSFTSGDVTIRAHRQDDVPGIVEQCTDPLSVQWTTVPVPYEVDMGRGWVGEMVPEGWRTGAEHTFAIESTHPDGVRRFSGSISLRDRPDRRAEIAFGAHPAVRGRGVMTTAVNLLLDYGFEGLGLETVVWFANEGNVGSRRVAWKTGFTFAGTMHAWLDHRGVTTDAWVGTLHRLDTRDPRAPWDVPVTAG